MSDTKPSTPDADVLVVGAGPTGLALAAALAVRGIRTAIVDRQAEGANTTRAAVVHARTLEVLEPLGVTERLVGAGLQAGRFTVRDRDRVLVPIDFTTLPTRYPYALMVSQEVTEAVLLQRTREAGVQVRRPLALQSFTQDAEGVTAILDDGSRPRFRFLVGADGMHSAVRQQAGIGFSGGTQAQSFVLADVRFEAGAEVPPREVVLFFSPAGMVVVAPLPGGIHRIVAATDDAPASPGRADVQQLLDARGPGVGRALVAEVLWGSRFRVHHRVADTYRTGRVVLAGDAAHVHSPAGGQGMNVGIQDAIALAEALAAALAGDDQALDRYGRQRQVVARQVVSLAGRLTGLAVAPPALSGARNMALSLLARRRSFRNALAWRLSGLVFR
ncbi:MAG TPA: FAD-dependent oxidoreductase [Ramlibacter sp.]|jgi:2-polyprenyl-6-methoxyphenol hydroxylase-like FAD-dependent oxidoreductase|uniref:FAD-dependent oxidoreductase n=1 Tax=Ramlibacter sp. TaxID=1917967 RepID=UPI002D6A55BC|nr:FAD-dependent oxidoreductase [Ramlibacter sp.]HZY19217.1 FAD-dependent oxidoreductase [Ramlibacter sp.]